MIDPDRRGTVPARRLHYNKRYSMSKRFVFVLALSVSLVIWQAEPIQAQQAGPQIMPNYRGADIRQVIEAVGEVTGRNFLVDPRVQANVTLLSFSPMSPGAPRDT